MHAHTKSPSLASLNQSMENYGSMRVYENERDKLNDSAAVSGIGIVFPAVTGQEEEDEEEEEMQFSERKTIR